MNPNATRAETATAHAAGRAACVADKMRAPALNATIRRLVADSSVGEPRTIQIFSAFTFGFDEETNRELDYLMTVGDAPSVPDRTAAADTGWCRTCQTVREIADQTTVDYPTRRGWVESYVVQLVCGHQDASPEKVVGPSPAPAAVMPVRYATVEDR